MIEAKGWRTTILRRLGYADHQTISGLHHERQEWLRAHTRGHEIGDFHTFSHIDALASGRQAL